ncbi:MAG: hypothetical protein CVV34_01505 [Methanomicrobiales archaeon HGW-Methanomicrobiales-5]|nr:MAG: hypothetical protein CVV34_01505 [Methanomicrobiales archaeon HGW-Methanomicrobiales-5]
MQEEGVEKGMNYKKIGIIGVAMLVIVVAAFVFLQGSVSPIGSDKERLQSDVATDVDVNRAATIALLNVKDTASLSPDFSLWDEATVALSTT